MLDALRIQIAARMLAWGKQLQQLSAESRDKCASQAVLIFFHGYSLAHTLRPLVMARALRDQGYAVALAGQGPHTERIRKEGFAVYDVETMPQSRMDEFVSRGDYGYYDMAWVERCVRSERRVIQALRPDLVVHDMKPTVTLSARLEGVDDAGVTQGYNQPGYPHPIAAVGRLDAEIGPLGEFLARYADEVKEQRSFYLVADIPEFHPPGKRGTGFHYIGPLLDRPAEPEHSTLLDEGWDTALPLIYLTCGSSGKRPDYLDELCESVRGKPYRILVTTAGRWQAKIRSEQVRVVDFVPGEWVLQRAKVLVGIVGIGAIYQALHQGVPIIGAAEHLDQEYHLNQVEALGLGIKLDRRNWDATEILHAVECVLGDYKAYKRRCEPFAGYLEKWDGGKVVAKLIHSHFQNRGQEYRAEEPYLVEEREFLRYLDSTTPESLSQEKLRRILRQGLAHGLPHVWKEGRLFFDQLDSWNWLYDREPRFFEADYRALEQKRQRFFSRNNGAIRSRSEWQPYRVRYTFCFTASGLPPGQRVKLFLPYPAPRAGHQKRIHLLSATPADMENCFAPHLGFFYGYTFRVDGKSEGREYGYACEVDVREQKEGEGAVAGPGEWERRKFLELPAGLLDKPEVVRFRRELDENTGKEKEERARAIYRRLVGATRFKKTKDLTQSLTYSAVSVLRDNVGHCITLSRAFMALCRAEGIPAREVSGALIGYPNGKDRYLQKNYGEPVFGHTWAEIFLDDRGWVPVEFHGIVIGAGSMTRDNVRDPGLRRSIEGQSADYLDYYFGRVDNQRLICSNSVKKIPPFLVENAEYPPGHRQRWERSDDPGYECRLEVECI